MQGIPRHTRHLQKYGIPRHTRHLQKYGVIRAVSASSYEMSSMLIACQLLKPCFDNNVCRSSSPADGSPMDCSCPATTLCITSVVNTYHDINHGQSFKNNTLELIQLHSLTSCFSRVSRRDSDRRPFCFKMAAFTAAAKSIL